MSDLSNPNEYELARRAREGDPEALHLLIAQNRTRLFALAYAELRHYADAQDAVAAALLNVCIHIRSLRRPERMQVWMNSIVRNEARHLRRGPEAPLSLYALPHEPLSTHTTQAVLRNVDIAQALQRLSPQQAQAIRLFYFGQSSIREIALRMGHSEGTVKSWLHYGRRRLAAAMREDAMIAASNTPEPPIIELLRSYAQQFDRDPMTADPALLERARARLRAELHRLPLSSELVHLAVAVHWNWVDDADALIAILADYLQQPLPVEEEAWARYEYVNTLTVLKRSAEVVANQRAALEWGRACWEAGRLASESLLHFISNFSQAEQWLPLGLREEWLSRCTELMAAIPQDADSRMERFYTLRTLALMLQAAGRWVEALATTERIRAMAEEDPTWERAYEMEAQADFAAMHIQEAQQDTGAFLLLAEHARTLLDEKYEEVDSMTPEARTRLMIQYDNLACPLYFARCYALSIPLHRRTLELGYNQEFLYPWLAAAIWAHTGDHAETLELIRQGRARCRSLASYRKACEERPEFQDIKTSSDFLEATDGSLD